MRRSPPDTLDRVAVNVKAHLDAFTFEESCRTTASPFYGMNRHPDHAGKELVCRMWDLAAAYRQLARSPAHESFKVVACWDPAEGRYRYFRQLALAFGASSSVLSFNWVGNALARVLVAGLKIGATCFYDGFTVVESRGLAASATQSVDEVFALLGWDTKAQDLHRRATRCDPGPGRKQLSSRSHVEQA